MIDRTRREVLGVVLLVIITMILGTVIGGFVLQVGDADNDPAQDITIITDDRSYVDAVIVISVPVVAFLAREV